MREWKDDDRLRSPVSSRTVVESALAMSDIFETNWKLAGARRPPATDAERALMEELIVKRLTRILEDALISVDERIAALAAREFEGALRVSDAETSKKRARKLSADDAAKPIVKRGGRLCDVQLFLEGGDGGEETTITATFAVELPGSRMGPVRESEYVGWFDAAVVAALNARGIAAQVASKEPMRIGAGVTLRRKPPTS